MTAGALAALGVAAAVGAALLAGSRSRRRSRPVFAWWYGIASRRAERGEIGRRRVALLTHVSGRVLDLGVGTGESLKHLPAAASGVVALDPDPAMLRQARDRLGDTAVPVLLVRAAGEALPIRDGALDSAVAALVLCTVDDPRATAGELHRALRPGGRLHLMEHVRADDALLASWQDRVQPVWSWVNGGCRPNRATLEILEDAGFLLHEVATAGFPVLPHVQGVAIRSER